MRADPASLTIGEAEIAVELRRSPRARSLTLRVASGTGAARVTAPPHVSLRDIRHFLEDHEDWLAARQAAQPGQVRVDAGMALPIRGVETRLVAADVRRITRDGDALLLPKGKRNTGALLRGWLKAEARADIAASCDAYAPRIGRMPARITLRDTRSRWGSCTSAGALMLSWRLILAPKEVLDYVVLHEMAHLLVMNHSPAFWDIVGAHMPDYAQHRAWLKHNGGELQRFDFG